MTKTASTTTEITSRARPPATRTLADRLANRLSRHLPGPRIAVAPATPLVTFTFDDCPDSALEAGATILEAAGARGTYYISGGLVGTLEPARRLIGADGVKELAQRGHEIASHTFSHIKLGALSRAELAADLARNEAFLDALIGATGPRNFASPYALTTPFAQRRLRERYLTARSGIATVNRGAVDPHLLGGVEIGAIRRGLDELGAFVDDAVADPGWLIFFTHDVARTHTPYGTTPDLLARLVERVLARGCAIVTVNEALETLGVRRSLAAALQNPR